MERKILVTGDYWHREFQHFIEGCPSATLVSTGKVESVSDQEFDLIVVFQSHPDQVSQATIERIQAEFANTPMVAMLGSWCEGEQRTGHPWPGVLRIYWHQWQGRYETFIEQLESAGIAGWHQPKTASSADRIQMKPVLRHRPHASFSLATRGVGGPVIGICAASDSQFQMLRDAIECFGWRSVGLSESVKCGESVGNLSSVCIDAEPVAIETERKIGWIKESFPSAKIILLANFPRVHQWKRWSELGVSQLVSKPFELNDLRSAVERAHRGAAMTVS